MKRTLLALSALAALTAGSMTAATAQELHVGPGGVGVGPNHYYDYDRDRGNCRTIITHRTNDMGNSVTVRRRVCD
jgi:outer membrane scaffolding protein for murein synthesis (MipA/OmpV family)